jgi:hypothetical protein
MASIAFVSDRQGCCEEEVKQSGALPGSASIMGILAALTVQIFLASLNT